MLHKNGLSRSLVLFFKKLVRFFVGKPKPLPEECYSLLEEAIKAESVGDTFRATELLHRFVVARAQNIHFETHGGKRSMDYL
jgi:hypothetical protein